MSLANIYIYFRESEMYDHSEARFTTPFHHPSSLFLPGPRLQSILIIAKQRWPRASQSYRAFCRTGTTVPYGYSTPPIPSLIGGKNVTLKRFHLFD